MSEFKFSGHDTFHCKQQWLLKGLKLLEKDGYGIFSQPENAITQLGVGKNMVQSIVFWLKAFGLIDKNNEISELSKHLFLRNKFDPFIEDEGTLWLLQYKICNTNYSSIYKLIFSEYFNEKVTLEFTETQIINYIEKKIFNNKEKVISRNTLKADFNVFFKSYAVPEKSMKTIEDDYNSLFIDLNLITKLKSKNETIFKINKEYRNNLSETIFAYCLLDFLGHKKDILYSDISDTLGAYFCLSTDGLDNLIDKLCLTHPEFIYKSDAGTRQIQIKGLSNDYQFNLLKTYYGI